MIICRIKSTDVAGFVVAVYESGMEGVQDIYKREVVVVLEDTGVLATRLGKKNMVTCSYNTTLTCPKMKH